MSPPTKAARRPRPRTRVLEERRQNLQQSASEVRSLALQIQEMGAQAQRALAAELLGVSDQLRTLSSEDLAQVAETLRIQAEPRVVREDLRATGEGLARVALSVASLSDTVLQASSELTWAALAGGADDPSGARSFSMGSDLSLDSDALSAVARRLLALGDEQRRFLRILLGKGRVKSLKSPRSHAGMVALPKGPAEEIWGGLESEDLVRRKTRKGSEKVRRPRSSKRILNFDTER